MCLTTDGSAVCSVQGSHKSNIQTPVSMDDYSRLVTEVNTKKGDVVIFCEAWCATTQATSWLFAALAHAEGAAVPQHPRRAAVARGPRPPHGALPLQPGALGVHARRRRVQLCARSAASAFSALTAFCVGRPRLVLRAGRGTAVGAAAAGLARARRHHGQRADEGRREALRFRTKASGNKNTAGQNHEQYYVIFCLIRDTSERTVSVRPAHLT